MIILLSIAVVLLALAVVYLINEARHFDKLVREIQEDMREVDLAIAILQAALDAALNEPIMQVKASHNEHVAEWLAEIAKHPEGSPKHTAYLNRLREVGAIDDGGGDDPGEGRSTDERSTDGGVSA